MWPGMHCIQPAADLAALRRRHVEVAELLNTNCKALGKWKVHNVHLQKPASSNEPAAIILKLTLRGEITWPSLQEQVLICCLLQQACCNSQQLTTETCSPSKKGPPWRSNRAPSLLSCALNSDSWDGL